MTFDYVDIVSHLWKCQLLTIDTVSLIIIIVMSLFQEDYIFSIRYSRNTVQRAKRVQFRKKEGGLRERNFSRPSISKDFRQEIVTT